MGSFNERPVIAKSRSGMWILDSWLHDVVQLNRWRIGGVECVWLRWVFTYFKLIFYFFVRSFPLGPDLTFPLVRYEIWSR